MPEIKHNFTGGKMNKDLDERLIPNGEYTDAMNIQVSTSEGSEVGTVQNILGNKEMDYNNSPASQAVDGGVVVSSIADEKNDKLYYFVWAANADYILEYSRDDNTPKPVLVDINKDTLKFRPETTITGINIIDDMLFWTDNSSEPKKINIQRCKQGTTDFLTQTKLVNESQHPGAVSFAQEDIKEKHITVIKKAPRKPLNMVVNSFRDPEKTYTGVITVASSADYDHSFKTAGMYNFSGITTEDGSNTFKIQIKKGVRQGAVIDPIGPINNGNTNDPSTDGLTGWHVNPNYPSPAPFNNIKIGTKIVFKPFDDDGTPPGLPVTDYVIKGVIEDWLPTLPATPFVPAYTTPTTTTTNAFGITTTFGGITFPAIPAFAGQDLTGAIDTSSTSIRVKAIAINGFPPVPTDGENTLDYVVDLFDEEEKLFEFKFPRFSYRYKYEDGEYSPFAPFTQVAFLPGSFDYHPRKGYNLGMTNRAYEIELSRIVTSNTPKDVVSIDILFKDEPSPNIYVVDTIRPNEFAASGTLNKWNQLAGDWENDVASIPYVITEESIQNVVPSNQLLRPWDNVPRRALAQDVTGNRIVYGNYVQNYDLKTLDQKDYSPDFTVLWDHVNIAIGDSYFKENGLKTVTKRSTSSGTAKSIKSLREYQLGVVFTDKYGRETPVISNNLAVLKLEKDMADRANSIKVMLNDFASKPMGLTHLKFFVKETSGEYYNMAMDRFYDAEDGNVWLAFPSSDRNKIDIDTFLILKKGSDQDTLVSNAARYKVIAIENEAPNFIKTTRVIAASKKHTAGGGGNDLFTDAVLDVPVIGNNEFKMRFSPWGSGPGRNLDKISDADLYVEFTKDGQFSDRYKIASIANDEVLDADGVVVNTGVAFYSIQLEEALGDDVNFISNDTTGATSTSIESGAIVNIYKYKVENKPQFDGRFFVKIHEDDVFSSNIGESFIESLEYRTTASKKVYSMKPSVEHLALHWGDTNKMLTNGYGKTSASLNSIIAPFYWMNSGPNDEPTNNGYYRVDEFASMATYFRKYRKASSNASTWFGVGDLYPGTGLQNDIRQLVPSSSGSANEEYPTGSYWKDHTNWDKELGKVGQEGYTARWKIISNIPVEIRETRFVGADDPIHTDVWFIDAGPAAAKRSTNDNLSWNYLSPNSLNSQLPTSAEDVNLMGYENRISNPGGHSDQSGLVDNGSKWNMQLSYGGIFGSEDSNSTDNFFNIGGFAGSTSSINPYYQNHTKNTSFVQSVDSGAQFRWREDPTGTVYTLSTSISQKRLLRHSARRTPTVAKFGGNNSGGSVSMAEDLSFNFTSGWDLRNITPAMTWNPVQVGKISNGLEVTLKAANSSGTTTGNTITSTDTGITGGDLSIYVPSLTGDNAVGDDAIIHVGMALEKYTKNENGAVQQSINHLDNLGTSAEKFLVVREIIKMSTGYELKLGGYTRQLQYHEHNLAANTLTVPLLNSDLVFVQVGMNGYSHNSEFNINTIGREHNGGCVGAVGYTLDFLEYIDPEPVLSENPAIWETEPKDIKDLDIYYEASPTIPMTIDASNVYDAVPIGSVIEKETAPIKSFLVIDHDDSGGIIIVEGNGAYSGYGTELAAGNGAVITRPDGLTFKSVINTRVNFQSSGNWYSTITLDEDLYTKEFKIPYHNCYSFGNGVESNRIRDNFNLPFITNGVKVSTTLEHEYEEEHRKYGLIYSGIYNSVSGVNNLNQFVAAEKITKDINPIYGSIQKLHSRDTDLVTLCEDKCLRILANKDAVYNADGNPQLTANERVLGQTVPFVGEYGISTNPESFASESYRAYFTDRVRGAVMRLSKDGLTPISDHGMKDWFRDNLKLNNTSLGSYDDKKEEYNLTLSNRIFSEVEVLGFSKSTTGGPYEASGRIVTSNFIASQISVGDNIIGIGIPPTATVVSKVNLGGGKWKIELSSVMDESVMGSYHGYGNVSNNQVAWSITIPMPIDLSNASTISFKEDVKGWVSFKSFLPENAISMANDYYTFKDGGLWKHHDETVDRNTFYGDSLVSSSVEVVLNDSPSSIKDFHTLNYEGSQSKIDLFVSEGLHIGDPFQPNTTYNDQEIYNLSAKDGWYVEKIFTDKEEGYVNEFIEKEGKWYNNINRKIDISLDSADTADFTFQGIGIVGAVPGCTDPLAENYDPAANVDDGSCVYIPGCTDPTALNYDATATVDDGTCTYPAPILGCTDSLALNYDASATIDDGSCTYKVSIIPGCTDPLAQNYNPLATVDNMSCTYGPSDDDDDDIGADALMDDDERGPVDPVKSVKKTVKSVKMVSKGPPKKY